MMTQHRVTTSPTPIGSEEKGGKLMEQESVCCGQRRGCQVEREQMVSCESQIETFLLITIFSLVMTKIYCVKILKFISDPQ